MKTKTPAITSDTRFRGVSALARRCGVSPAYISQALHGKLKPGKALARKLKRLGVEIEAEAASK